MKGRATRGGRASSTDLMACLPPRAQLMLMPKPICSPSRSTTGATHWNPVRPRTRLSMAKDRNYTSAEIAEPASPKITCSGQIKRSSKSRAASKASCDGGTRSSVKKNWLEEIEKLLHKQIKKDAMHFIAAMRGLRCFSMQRLCSLQGPVDCATDEEEEGKEREGEKKQVESKSTACRTTLLECLMMLEESSGGGVEEEAQLAVASGFAVPPPPNALLLMRCRSTPAKGVLRGGDGLQVAAEMVGENKMEDVRAAEITSTVGSLNPFTRSQSCRRFQRKKNLEYDNGANLSVCPPPAVNV